MRDRPERPKALLAKVVRHTHPCPVGWLARGVDPQRVGDRRRLPRPVGVGDGDLEAVAGEVAEEHRAAGPTEWLQLRPGDLGQRLGRDVANGEQLGTDRAFVLGAGPGDPLARDAQPVGERAGKAVGVPATQRRAKHELGVAATMGVERGEVDVELLDLANEERLRCLAEVSTRPGEVATIEPHPHALFELAGRPHQPPTSAESITAVLVGAAGWSRS